MDKQEADKALAEEVEKMLAPHGFKVGQKVVICTRISDPATDEHPALLHAERGNEVTILGVTFNVCVRPWFIRVAHVRDPEHVFRVSPDEIKPAEGGG